MLHVMCVDFLLSLEVPDSSLSKQNSQVLLGSCIIEGVCVLGGVVYFYFVFMLGSHTDLVCVFVLCWELNPGPLLPVNPAQQAVFLGKFRKQWPRIQLVIVSVPHLLKKNMYCFVSSYNLTLKLLKFVNCVTQIVCIICLLDLEIMTSVSASL